MGQNFDDYPGLQQKSKCAHISVTHRNPIVKTSIHLNSKNATMYHFYEFL